MVVIIGFVLYVKTIENLNLYTNFRIFLMTDTDVQEVKFNKNQFSSKFVNCKTKVIEGKADKNMNCHFCGIIPIKYRLFSLQRGKYALCCENCIDIDTIDLYFGREGRLEIDKVLNR